MQQYTVYLYLQTALHVSGGISTHHQQLISLYLQYLAFETVTATCGERDWIWTVDTVVWAPDDGWRYHPKHVEQFAGINTWLYT